MKLEREFHTIQIQGFIQLMPGLVSWDKWTPKAGQNQFGSFAQGNACTDRQEILNRQRQTPKLYSYSSQGVGKTSKNAELDDLWKLFVILLWSCTGSLIRQNFTSLCALSISLLYSHEENVRNTLVQAILYMVLNSTPVTATFSLHCLFFFPLEIALKITMHISKHVILQYKQVNFGQRKKHLSVMDSQISRTDLIP